MADTDMVDAAALAHSPLLAGLPNEELGAVLAHVERVSYPAGSELARRGTPDDALSFILSGEASCHRSEANPVPLRRGDFFGELLLAGAAMHPATVVAVTDVRVARLKRASMNELSSNHPRAALHLTQALLRTISVPSAAERRAASDYPARVCAARRAVDVLPREIEGARVVAVAVDHRATSLSASVPPGRKVEPITTRTWVGREIFGRSAGLVFLEVARVLGIHARLGPSITTGRVIEIDRADLPAATATVHRAVVGLVERDVPFVEETWDVDAAIAHFEERGWSDAALVLAGWREPTVTLIGCGETRAIGTGPTVPSTGWLEGIGVVPYPGGLLLDYGSQIRRFLPVRPVSTMALERRSPRYAAGMTIDEKAWLELLGATSVGSFNRACIGGRVREIVHVSEGFHEKHIARTADEVKARGDVRVIAIAGPSSSGKTTFIKRLKVQLEVVGIHPLELSLDDYYLERERAARDDDGKLDFEALESLDLELLADHVRRLLAGERVRTARFDFRTGKSASDGGRELQMSPRDVLLVEGIHGLNPHLLPALDAGVYRIFVHVATSLPFDRLSWLEPADLRLLRRIVRDRHQRGTTAADTLARWPSVRRGERLHIQAHQGNADRIFDSSLVYEASVLKVFAERYLLEVPRDHPEFAAAQHLRRLLDPLVPIEADHVPPTSILREFIGQSGFTY